MAKILIADDEGAVRNVLRVMLDALGHDVVEASDGASALARASEQRFDAILLDVRMPGVGGYEVLDRLRGTTDFDVPVIMVTGQNAPDELMEEAERGALERIAKPFTLGELERTVERVLAMSDDERAVRRHSVAHRFAIFDAVRKIRSTIDDPEPVRHHGRRG